MKQDELPKILREYGYPQLFWSEDSTQPDGNAPKRWVPIYPERGWAYKHMIEHFLGCLEKGTTPSLTPEECALGVDILITAYHFSVTDQWIESRPDMEDFIVPNFTPLEFDA